jgi:hypothetical protein
MPFQKFFAGAHLGVKITDLYWIFEFLSSKSLAVFGTGT